MSAAAPDSMVAKAFALLHAFPTDADTAGVTELARATGQPKATVHRLARILVELGLLDAVDSRYRLGVRLFELGHRAARHEQLRTAALPAMIRLREQSRLTVHLAVLDGSEIVYLDILHVQGGLEIPSRVGGRMPAHATGLGRAILSRSSDVVVDAALATAATRFTPRTTVAPGLLRAELERCTRRGFAVDVEQSARGLVCVAAPVMVAGDVVAALSLSGRSTDVPLPRLAPVLVDSAAAVGRRLASTLVSA